jgi:HSP20 family protein
MRRIAPFPILSAADAAADVRRLIEEVSRSFRPGDQAECVPGVDVIETAEALRVVVDLPGVAASSLQVVLKGGVLVIAGVKEQPARTSATTFHLLERSFGRFGRGVPVGTSFDGARATARLARGELTVTLPKISERRGRPIPVPIATE